MAHDPDPPWLLPAEIPFADLKARDLEECVYWLLDALGAKDLEWRLGGAGGGAADGGRDLEAVFYTPAPGDDLDRQSWWVECKGRSGTVEPEAVKTAVNNAMARADLDVLVIATNTTFSNPTRDWVAEWQRNHPRPRVRLWDQTVLERQLSRHPQVVMRLFAKALSLEGRAKAVEERFWGRFEYATPGSLADFWVARETMSFEALGVFAFIASEFAGGSITQRPWAAATTAEGLAGILQLALLNTPYLMVRSQKNGQDSEPLVRALAYLLLAALQAFDPQDVADHVTRLTGERDGAVFPDHVREVLLLPLVRQLQSELQDVCSSDCKRMLTTRRALRTESGDELETYWRRLSPDGLAKPDEPERSLRLEKLSEPCIVGFPVDKDVSCPLFEMEASLDNIAPLLTVLARVSWFRKDQAFAQWAAKEAAP